MKMLLPLFGSLAIAGFGFSTSAFAEDEVESSPELTELPQATPAFLGVAVAESRVSAELAQSGAALGSVALTVTSVHPGSPAETAGLQTGDTLLKIDDQKLLHPVQLSRLVAAMPVEKPVGLAIVRNGQAQTLAATLAARPAALAQTIPNEIPAVEQEIPGWPDEFGPMLRFEALPMDAGFEDLRKMRERMQQRLDQMFERPDFGGPEAWFDRMQLQPGDGPWENRSVRVLDDGQHRLTITTDAQGRHLKAVTAEGEVLFEGPIDTAEQLDEVPAKVREKLPSAPSTPPANIPAGQAV